MFTSTFDVICHIFSDSVVVGVVVLAILYTFQKYFGFYVFKIEDNARYYSNPPELSTTHCNAVDCVRCNKYNLIMKTATDKMNYIEDEIVKQRIKSSLENRIPIDTQSLSEPNPNVFLCNSLLSKTFWDSCHLTQEFKQDLNRLEKGAETILKEFKNVYREDYLHCWKRNSTDAGCWDVFHLVNQGVNVEENLALCPNTATILDELSTAMKCNVFGNILFSVVKPSTLISPHYGPTNIRLRCHLGLITNSECVLHVGKDQATWEQNQCLIFDDSYLHSVEHSGFKEESNEGHGHINDGREWRLMKNEGRTRDEGERRLMKNEGPSLLQSHQTDSDNVDGSLLGVGDRAVLIVDVWHPELSKQERNVLDNLFSPEIGDYGEG